MGTRHAIPPHRSSDQHSVIIRLDDVTVDELTHRILARLEDTPDLTTERVRDYIFEVALSVRPWRLLRRMHAPTSRIRMLDTPHGAQAMIVGTLSARLAEVLEPLKTEPAPPERRHTPDTGHDVIDLRDDAATRVALIEVAGGKTWLRDLGSDQGTWLTDVDGRHRLAPLDRMEITESITIRLGSRHVTVGPVDE